MAGTLALIVQIAVAALHIPPDLIRALATLGYPGDVGLTLLVECGAGHDISAHGNHAGASDAPTHDRYGAPSPPAPDHSNHDDHTPCLTCATVHAAKMVAWTAEGIEPVDVAVAIGHVVTADIVVVGLEQNRRPPPRAPPSLHV